tara:strand:+ start:441 stop:650 length:210 start_codon:yes stop_codon:yes gene_type:complete
MSLFGSLYLNLPDKDKNLDKYKENNKIKKKITEKSIIEKVNDKVDEVFIKMERRGSYTNFRIDYPWLTI